MSKKKTKKKNWDISNESWEKFLTSIDFDSDVNNFKYPFNIMTKKYGVQFIEYCQAAWIANDNMNEEEFCKINANMPIGFFNGRIKNNSSNYEMFVFFPKNKFNIKRLIKKMFNFLKKMFNLNK